MHEETQMEHRAHEGVYIDVPQFIPGRKLSQLFFESAVRPIIDRSAPQLKYAAGLLGSGSDVLGFDDEMSTDHHWGPRVMIFLDELDHKRVHDIVDRELRDNLPTTFLGYPTNFSLPDPNDNNVRRLVPVETGPVNHRVDLLVPRDYFLSYLGFDIDSDIEPVDWLTFPGQKLRSIADAAVFHDEIGLNELVTRFAYYPHDVWLYLLAAAWNRVGQEEHLAGRAGFVGDELGASLIGSRLTREAMNLCFLMERLYAPYPKWFGTAFRE